MLNSFLSKSEIEKFKRQAIVDNFDGKCQKMLINSKILIIGVGGLGCPVALYLSSAGVKTIGLIDSDRIEVHNLPRQILYSSDDLNKSKIEVAVKNLKSLNKDLSLKIYNEKFSVESANIIENFDLVIECSDDIETKYIANDYSKKHSKNIIIGALLGWEGQIFCINNDSSCYRCLFPKFKENIITCSQGGVISPLCGVIGTMISLEAIKFCIGKQTPKLIVYNGYNNDFMKIDLKSKDKICKACNLDSIDYSAEAISKKISTPKHENFNYKKISWVEYYKRSKEYKIVDVRSSNFYNLFNIKDSINVPFDNQEMIESLIIDNDKKYAIVCNKGVTAVSFVEKYFSDKKNFFVIEGGYSTLSNLDSNFPKI